MRVINKKYLLIILFVGIILTGVIVLKSNKEIQLDNEISKQKINNKTFAMYIENNNTYEEYNESKFPEGYVLNINESKCIDNNGKEVDNILSFNNREVTVTSGKTTYCYLYFDKSLGLEIKEKNPNGLKIDKVRGEMYRFQGQQADGIENYICFGTSDKEDCVKDTDHYMYRIIGIEASTGRVKVIKKEALKETENETYQWYTDYNHDIKLPESTFFKAINGEVFLENTDYVPKGWEEKIASNKWIYGDMLNNDTLGIGQAAEGLYLIESGQREAMWDVKANEEEEGAQPYIVGWNGNVEYYGQTLYFKEIQDKWDDTILSKVSLMYTNDYSYSVGDEVKCKLYYEDALCKTGWMHISQNDNNISFFHEWTMARRGWNVWDGGYDGIFINEAGYIDAGGTIANQNYIRPVFYINASVELLNGEGILDNPFIIN